ncbi:MAG: lipopolysaccharide heptosyltransferase II [Armatimonadota bacterium]
MRTRAEARYYELDHWPPATDHRSLNMNILIIQLEYIGDVLLSTPALRVLCEAYPDAAIDVVVRPVSVPVLQHHPGVRRLIPLDINPYHGINPRALLAALRDIRRERYDLALNLLPRRPTPTLLAGLSGATRVCGYAHKLLGALLFTERRRYAKTLHKANALVQMLEEVGVPPAPHRGLEMWVDAASEASADAKWRAAGLEGNRRVVGLNPGGYKPEIKRWPPASFAALHDRLRADGYTPVFFGGPNDLEIVDDIRARCANPGYAFTGQISLHELAVLLRNCAALVTNDSGPMHIAASQHTPTVAIFGPTPSAKFGPYGTPHRIASADMPCLGCWRRSCRTLRCMTELTPERVYGELRELLDSSDPGINAGATSAPDESG